MKIRTAHSNSQPSSLSLIAVVVLTSRPAVAQSTKIQGVIDGRSGATMSLKIAGSPDTTVLLTDSTDVGEVEGVFHGRTKQMPMTALIPGLPVQVSGTYNAQNQFVADSVKFKGSDLKAAMDAQAGLQPTMQKVAANTAADPADRRRSRRTTGRTRRPSRPSSPPSNRRSPPTKPPSLPTTSASANSASTTSSAKPPSTSATARSTSIRSIRPQLVKLAQQAKGITAYIIQVQGYASAVGSAALNQKLSSERANAVTAILEQQGGIPLTNMLAPGAMGTSSPGRLRQNRRRPGREPPRRRPHPPEQRHRRNLSLPLATTERQPPQPSPAP